MIRWWTRCGSSTDTLHLAAGFSFSSNYYAVYNPYLSSLPMSHGVNPTVSPAFTTVPSGNTSSCNAYLPSLGTDGCRRKVSIQTASTYFISWRASYGTALPMAIVCLVRTSMISWRAFVWQSGFRHNLKKAQLNACNQSGHCWLLSYRNHMSCKATKVLRPVRWYLVQQWRSSTQCPEGLGRSVHGHRHLTMIKW